MADAVTQQPTQRVVGVPFGKGDPRINRDGSKISAGIKARNKAMKEAQRFLNSHARMDGGASVKRLRRLFAVAFKRADAGDVQWANFLWKAAYGNFQSIEVTGKESGPLAISINDAVARLKDGG
jgi:hypothetical protein